MLGFKKDDVIRLSPEPPAQATPVGFLAGQLHSRQGLFPAESVRAISRSELSDLSQVEGCARLAADSSLFHDSSLKDGNAHSNSNNTSSDRSQTDYQDGHFSMMEFAMIHFKQSLEK